MSIAEKEADSVRSTMPPKRSWPALDGVDRCGNEQASIALISRLVGEGDFAFTEEPFFAFYADFFR